MSEFSVYRPVSNGAKLVKNYKEYEKNESKERKRSLLCLMYGYLRDCSLHDTADALANEAQLVGQFEVCDNIDLDIILQDYQSYYYTKFNKAPRLTRKIPTDLLTNGTDNGAKSAQKRNKKSIYTATTSATPLVAKAIPEKANDFQIGIRNLSITSKSDNSATITNNGSFAATEPLDSITKLECIEQVPRPSLCEFEGYSSEWREMAELITKEIVPKKLGFTWADCVGVEDSVELLKESVVYPLKYPDLFTGLLTPWKGILLYGPPGTGKTLLAKAVSCETDSTFINLTISTFVSKWRGDSEKMLKVLFDVARLYAPSTIFIDELDALASKYEDNQHDASRRFKSELLVQLDGLLGGNEQVFVLATTNLPWNLNCAILRRFEKRILLNVPSWLARMDLFRYFFKAQLNDFPDADFRCMADITDSFTGSDIRLVCKEVLMNSLREKLKQIVPNSRSHAHIKVRSPTIDDVKNAVKKIHPTTTKITIEKYEDWARNYGSL